jgi:phosphoribosylanthranilate isomerase
MQKTLVQIYEIQTPEEARSMISLGVDHIGSVLTDVQQRHDPNIRETLSVVRALGAVSSLIPLFSDVDAIVDCIDFHGPDVVHFCDALRIENEASISAALTLQKAVKKRFPHTRMMRTIPIPTHLSGKGERILETAARFEPFSDYFLTDTVLVDDNKHKASEQPVDGFVGITGKTCDWQVARRLVVESSIPVILAGGLSPENVKDGILQVRPYGVDSCTQTNARDENGQTIRFRKDKERVKRLIGQARLADKAIEQNNQRTSAHV